MQLTIGEMVAAFFFFVGLAYALFGVMWIQAYRIKPANLQDPARFQATYYWRLHRKHYPHSVLPLCGFGFRHHRASGLNYWSWLCLIGRRGPQMTVGSQQRDAVENRAARIAKFAVN